ncbi:DUF1073 domain-containing protein [Methylobacterium sp. NMS14P]|uniref:DUF1073 domain-containing protein n=1 Tax=Methylobacterium sp. NMS14P TaxID=2894310 RepID=UPI00235A0DFC|nr:DUF1073 domain-containing protein [Methylobacterium sp. NMS14P]WCS27249.1 DUF1073 domain-containing protein [Methylobacterium sp. NMS14P]
MTKRAARRRRAQVAAPAAVPAPPRTIIVPHEATALAKLRGETEKVVDPFKPALHPPGVAPDAKLAMDDAFTDTAGWAQSGLAAYGIADPAAFLGYPVLSELAQRPEYRRVSETVATEMTRRWIRVTAKGDKDKSNRVEAIVSDLERLGVRDHFRRASEHDGFFGRAHIYVDLAGGDAPTERLTPIGNGRDAASIAKVRKGSLRGFRVVEPVWCYPGGYNTTDPLGPDWYHPTLWYVQGKAVHATRLLTLVGREVPDLLKPAYSFGGVSLSQMVRPYVDIWLKNQSSVAALIRSFSVSGVKLDLVSALASGGADNLQRRIELFTLMRDNQGTMVLDKGNGGTSPAEEFFNVSTPLGTLDVLLAQSQEHIASIAGIPLIKFTGLQPSGLNASSDGEIRAWYDWIHAKQEDDYRAPLTTVIDLIQLSRFGDVDPDITFTFEPLWTMDEKERAEVREVEARTAQAMIDSNVILPSEERQRIARQEGTAYPGLDLTLDVDDVGGEGDLPGVSGPSDERDDADDTDRRAAA